MSTATLDHPEITMERAFGLRQLDERRHSGITVALYWCAEDQSIALRVEDEVTWIVPVEPHEAAFAFAHPYLFEPDEIARERAAQRRLYACTEADDDDTDYQTLEGIA